MTIREQLTEKKSALEALKERIEANDVEAIKAGEELMTEIKSLDAQVKASEKAEALLKSIGPSKEEKTMDQKTAFETFIEQAKEVDTSEKGWSVSTHVKAATDVTVVGANIHETDRIVANVPSVFMIADLFNNITVSGNAITYFVKGATEGAPAVTAEGAKKPQLHIGFTPKTAALKKVAGYTKETDEVLADAPFLASAVESTMVYELGKKENAVVVGDIVGTSGIGALTYANGSGAQGMLEAILAAKASIASNSAYTADCVIMNPADIQAMRLLKDSNGQYIFGGPAYAPYGNGDYKADLIAWGIPVVASADITSGTFVVAAEPAVRIYRKGGADVKVYEQNEDDAIYNRVTVVAEKRLAVAVVELAAVIKVTEAAS